MWIVGTVEETFFLLDFFKERFLKREDNPEKKNEMKDTLHLGKQEAYEIEITHLTFEEWRVVDKSDLEVDAVVFFMCG